MMDPNGITTRVAVLESSFRGLREDIRDLKTEEIGDIKREVQGLRREWNESRQGMTRGEKIALSSVGVTVVAVIVAAIALVQAAPT